jgi:hypothetical protein
MTYHVTQQWPQEIKVPTQQMIKSSKILHLPLDLKVLAIIVISSIKRRGLACGCTDWRTGGGRSRWGSDGSGEVLGEVEAPQGHHGIGSGDFWSAGTICLYGLPLLPVVISAFSGTILHSDIRPHTNVRESLCMSIVIELYILAWGVSVLGHRPSWYCAATLVWMNAGGAWDCVCSGKGYCDIARPISQHPNAYPTMPPELSSS